MLKSMKQKFGSRRSSSSGTSKDDAAPAQTPKPASTTSASVISTRPAAPAAGRSQTAAREKPPLPSLTEEEAEAAYSKPPSLFRDVSQSEKQALFIRKLHLCAFTFDFTDQSKHVREKEIKRQTLLELVDFVNSGNGKFSESVAEDVIFMLSSNLFRALPATKSGEQDNLDPDEEEPALEPSWPHLQVISPCSVPCHTVQLCSLYDSKFGFLTSSMPALDVAS